MILEPQLIDNRFDVFPAVVGPNDREQNEVPADNLKTVLLSCGCGVWWRAHRNPEYFCAFHFPWPSKSLVEESNIRTVAHDYVEAGISVLPLRLDGSKAPAYLLPKNNRCKPSWVEYQGRLATPAELLNWFVLNRSGVGIIGGIVSGGLEVIDIDDGSLFEPLRKMVESIFCWLPIIETPSGGYHILYRCDEIGGNAKIAIDPSKEKQTLIETRGEGGYIAAAGSRDGVHKLGPYVQVFGPPLPEIPRISVEDRKVIWRAARTFDRGNLVEKLFEKRQKQLYRESHPYEPEADLPWDDFDARASWVDILEPAGWTSGDGIAWTRPGKQFGTSARINVADDGHEVLTVFSANAGPLSPSEGHHTWGKFSAWSLLKFGGDRKEAARQARKLGYGGSHL